MKANRYSWILLFALVVPSVAFAAQDPTSSPDKLAAWYTYLLIAAVSGGFGGLVHGIMRSSEIRYSIDLPIVDVKTYLGFVGDILVGIAAAAAVLYIADGFFGLTIKALSDVQWVLKFIALTIICGYTGSGLLDNLSALLTKRLLKAQAEVVQSEGELRNLRTQVQASAQITELLSLADAYMRWKIYDQALVFCDAAIEKNPNNADAYIRKSFVFATKAESLKDPKDAEEVVRLYNHAIEMTDKAIEVDRNSARAYYDRACYRQRIKKGTREEILKDLAIAIEKNDMLKKMAIQDPDLKEIQDDEKFKNLVKLVEPTEPPTARAAA